MGLSSSDAKGKTPQEVDVSYSSDTFDDISMSGSGSKGKETKSLQYLKAKASAKPAPIEESSDRYETDEFTSISQSHTAMPEKISKSQSHQIVQKPKPLQTMGALPSLKQQNVIEVSQPSIVQKYRSKENKQV